VPGRRGPRGRALQVDHAGLEPGELEQVVDEPTQALGLVEGLPEVLPVGGNDPVGEVLQQGGHRGQRCAELVRHRRDQVPTLAIDGGEVLGHPVERRGELTDLVRGRGPDPPGVVPARHGP
jgi:hypothetical protein